MKWCLEYLPLYVHGFRLLLFWRACDGAYDTIKIDLNWPHQKRSVNEINDMMYQLFADYIRGQLGDDEALLGKVTLLSPWKITDMWRWTKEANADDYNFT